MKPLAIDLFCGLGGWTSGLLAEGYLNVTCALGEMTVAKFANAALLCEVAASKLRHLQRIYDESPNNGGQR